jgi:rubrerythrin
VPTTAEGDPNLLDFAGSSQRQLLEHALAKELKAASLYDSQARAASDYQGQRLWRMLAETERGHAKYLRLQLKRLEG